MFSGSALYCPSHYTKSLLQASNEAYFVLGLKREVLWNAEVLVFGRETQHMYCMLLVGQHKWDLGQDLVIKRTSISATRWVFISNKIKARKSQVLPSEFRC